MSTGNSPQTLFRFVSYRNPNLAENSERNLRFIFRPKAIIGFFDSVPQTSDAKRLQELIKLANQFKLTPNVITSVAKLEEGGFSELLKLGKYLSTRKKLTIDELKSAKEYYIKFKPNTTAINSLWDNLIYQYITQNNFYVKEGIAHIITALHVGSVQTLTSNEELRNINGNELLDAALEAVIVLPEFLFHESIRTRIKNKSKRGISDRDSNLLQVNLEKKLVLSNQEQTREDLLQLKSELQNIEFNVGKSYEKNYRSALEKYQDVNLPNITLYEDQLEVIGQLEEDKAPEQVIKDAYDLLVTYAYPPFEFVDPKILSWSNLYPKLSQESFAVFLEYFTNADAVITKVIDYSTAKISVISDEDLDIDKAIVTITYDTFSDIYDKINSQSQSLSQKILTGSLLQKDEFVNIGNVLMLVSTKPAGAFTHLSYILKATKRSSFWGVVTNSGYANLQIQLENSSWNISNASVSATTNLGVQNENFTSLNVVDNTLTFPRFFINKFRTISNFTLTIFFANGRESTLSLTDVAVNTDYTGILTLKPIAVEEPIEVDDDTDTTGSTYSGKYFGLKRLGIAEYMKVVQTVHAYVPGEVSNIENVMASELRHKSINELTRTEETVTTTKSQEVEKISDTNKVNRAEMQTEVSK